MDFKREVRIDVPGVIDHIANWLKTYAEEAGCKGFVVGVSGGIDSAVTSTLAAKTGLEVLVLEMPIHQGEEQVNRAQKHISWLTSAFEKVRAKRVDLTGTFEEWKLALEDGGKDEKRFLSLANSRARLRMTTLYYYAAIHGYLVAGTGNKVEDFGVGFYTKYGDGGVDLSPIADLMKSEVYALGRELGVIPEILEAAPTDGLWGDARTDEDQLGATYDELEWAMEQQAMGRQPEEFSGRAREVFLVYLQLNSANRHKMNPIPVCSIPTQLKKAVHQG